MLVLNENQVKELELFIQELPVKYGVPLINLIRKFAEEFADSAKSTSTPESLPSEVKKPIEVEAE